MQRHQYLTEEVGKLDRLISAIASEVETERAATNHRDELLREMEDALAELRLARGVRLMLLNAYGVVTAPEAQRHSRSHRAMDWPRAGRCVA
jgi:hypothetical protein